MPNTKKTKEKLLEEFDKTILEPLDKKDWGICPSQILAIKQFISDIITQTREETIREITKSNTDYLTKLCWSDKDIEYFLRQYKSLINK